MSETDTFTTIAGPNGMSLGEVSHILVPGRGRNADGSGLSQGSANRIQLAAELYKHLATGEADDFGMVVPSGYKTPADRNGERVILYDSVSNGMRRYQGNPEAHSGRLLLQHLGIAPSHISAEMNSIDTVTNFVRAEQEDHFGAGDRRPVAIVAQASHLERMIKIIAPKTLRRDYIGVVVPEYDEPNQDSVLAHTFSKVVSAGLRPESRFAIQRTDFVAHALWKLVLTGQRIKPPATPYMTEVSR